MNYEFLLGPIGIVIIVFLVILFILWFILPFAIFGIKSRLDELIQQNNQIIKVLERNNLESPILNKNREEKIERFIDSSSSKT